ncbi:leucine-rich repeat domain-containing protein [Kineobactrum salinum]|uniref:Leucine-rich repeat domain-containing protein n=1 Tax=Kineobactrum salinum TaxID=2708301 RepID=A0A6C0U6V8_9GAMM|nr:hypothetical protein [Kineobactrum salinum]QIB66677.1 hypothetical protein G3T16_16020 [Kineobactrum salinum]
MRLVVGPVLLLLCACAQYDVAINERVVYTPRPLLTDFEVSDAGLQACLERAIDQDKISNAGQLQTLACNDAGIRELTGLARFSGLTRLELSGNQITDLQELSALLDLRTLMLEGNRIKNPAPLYGLTELTVLDLRGNPGLLCPARRHMPQLRRLDLPSHCR